MRYILLSHVLGLPVAYLLTSYFSNFYSGIASLVILSLVFQVFCGIIIFPFLKDAINAGLYRRNSWTSFLVLATVIVLAASSVIVSSRFPGLFNRRTIFMDGSQFFLFLGLAGVSTIGTLTLTSVMEQKGILHSFKSSTIFKSLKANLAGIFVAIFFFFTYFVFAQSLNFPGHRTLDQYFDTDISEWITRLTLYPTDEMPTIRAVHPAIMLILRPFVWWVSLMVNGNELQAVYFLSALAGASCVFLVWLIVKGSTGNTTYALIMASILGAGTSHLLLSSMLETYIFSALALIAFCFLLQSDRTSLRNTIPVGLLIFGITITNLAQACILYFFKLPHIKVLIKFILAVIAIALLLNVLQVRIYPNAEPTYKLSNLLVEQKYKYDLFETPWRLTGRISLISRAILLYGIVAPTPYILMDELGTNVPNFRTFEIVIEGFHVAGYKGLGDVTVKFWVVILALAIILFVRDLVTSPKQAVFSISLILCMGFSFGLHIVYGDDPLLYSPNWVYALVLFVASSFKKWADTTWFHVVLITFLGLIMYTNTSLIYQIMEVSQPFYGK